MTNHTATMTIDRVADAADETLRQSIDRRDDPTGVVVVRPGAEVMGRQALPYFVGISGASAGASTISTTLVIVPPPGAAEPHSHRGFETAVFLVSGRCDVRYGPKLAQRLTLEAGEFLFMPADVPHQPVNLDPEIPAVALVARNDANEQESIERFHDHGHGHDHGHRHDHN